MPTLLSAVTAAAAAAGQHHGPSTSASHNAGPSRHDQ